MLRIPITAWIKQNGRNPYNRKPLSTSQLMKVPPSIIEELREEIQSRKKRKRNANNVGTPPNSKKRS